ncbi:hypothetical protein C1645_877864 [Glomus cerebriforme]|uniref:Uncharacterized protein n=1 Tax=Glomus cerebriforme TaxID=658196 RepID=A0A397SUW4_9GLOM|nr:hypothetical protein C1645_877864 [Glomus cerebriforme]
MYVKNVDSSNKIDYSKRWNNANDDEKLAFSYIALCAEKVFDLMYPNYKEIEENMKQLNLDFNISIEFNQRKSNLFDEKDKSIFLDRREMNLRSIHRCSKLLDNLTDGSSIKEKNEFQNRNHNLEQQLDQLLLLHPELYSQEPWNKIGKRFIVMSILSLFLVIVTSLGFYFFDN